MRPDAIKSDFGWGWVSLLPSAPYSIRDESRMCVVGLAFERQRGVHAMGGSHRQDFDAWPGELAVTSPDVEMFSESEDGGEYLAVHLQRVEPDLGAEITLPVPRFVYHGDRRAIRLGEQLRRSMLAPHAQPQLIEEQAMKLLEHGLSPLEHRRQPLRGHDHDRQAHSRVLEYIDGAIDGSLSLDELSRVAGMPLLRFLRSFSNTVGSTPHAYVTQRRMQRARALLRATDDPIADIAASCGFAHQSHLGAVFKDRLGLSPRQYRVHSG